MIDKLVPRVFSSDQDQRLTTASQFIDALNINIDTDEDGNAGVIKNCKGTTPIAFPNSVQYTESDVLDVLGSCRDNERGRTYFFVHCDTASKNGVFYYEDSTNSIVVVTTGSYLAFDANNKISADVINGEFRRDGQVNSLLYFTDNKNEPRKINVDHADELDDLLFADLELYTSVMKQAPLGPAVASFAYNSDLGIGAMDNTVAYQFAYQYIYRDGEISSLSPTSVSYVPEEDSDGVFPNHAVVTMPHYRQAKNGITQIPGINKEVSRIRVLYREERGAEISPFRVLDEYNVNDGLTRTLGSVQEFEVASPGGTVYIFVDRGYSSTLPSVQEDTPFSAVPRVAKAQAINSSRLFYGNYVEGFHNLGAQSGINGDSGEKADVDITVSYPDVSNATSVSAGLLASGGVGSAVATTPNEFVSQGIDISAFPNNFNSGDVFDISISAFIQAAFEGNDILEGLSYRGPESGFFRTVLDNTTTGVFLGSKKLAYNFTLGNNLRFNLCSAQSPIQYSVPIEGTYTKAEIVSVLNEFLELNPITRNTTFTVGNGNFISGQMALRETVVTTDANGATVVYNAGTAITNIQGNIDQNPNSETTSFLEGQGLDPSPMHGKKVKVSYDVTLQFSFDNNNNTLKYRLIPSNVTMIPNGELGAGLARVAGPSDDQLDSNGSNVVENEISFTDASGSEISTRTGGSISGFTAGSNHSFAFGYYDNKGRIGSAQEIGSVYVEALGSSARSGNDGPATLAFTPSHEPPAWASGYRLLYAGPDDIKSSIDLYVDYPTKVIQKTKFFDGIPGSVFVKISSFIDKLRSDGIEFNSIYNVEEGDILRIISRREISENNSYVAGDGGSVSFMANPHTIADNVEGYDVFNGDFNDTIDFEVVSIVNMSENTADEDYPFLLNPDGTVDGGVFLELKCAAGLTGFGKNFVLSVGELIGNIANPFSLSRPNYVSHLQGIANPPVNLDRRAYREKYTDASLASTDDASNVKYLQHPGCFWDKGIRATLIKPKKRTAAKVYHEIGEGRSFLNRADQVGPHGDTFVTSKGFARYRDAFEFAIDEFNNNASSLGVLPGANTNDLLEVGGNPFSVRPQVDTFNMRVESERASYGSLVKANHIGKLNVASPSSAEERRESSIIHSGFQGSETLNLALQDFQSSNFKDLDVNNGDINALVSSAQHIHSMQSSKVSMIPISRSIIATAGGDNNLTVSNTVMGPEMSFNGDYGVDTDVAAVINVDGAIFFIDKGRRSIVKVSNKGFLPISDVSISRLIEKEFSKPHGGFSVGYDKDTKEVLFTFRPASGYSGATFAYSNKSSRWTTRYGFSPLAYLESENEVMSCQFGEGALVHLHNNETDFASFYGVKQASKISVVSTGKNPSQVKAYNAMGLESTQPMDVKITNRDQDVSFSKTRFNEKERSYYTDIPFDSSNAIKIYGYLDEADITDDQKANLVESVNADQIRIIGVANGIVRTPSTGDFDAGDGFPYEVNGSDLGDKGWGMLNLFNVDDSSQQSYLLSVYPNNPGSSSSDLIQPSYSGLTVLAFLYKGKWRIMDSLFRSAIGFGDASEPHGGDPGSFLGGDGMIQNSMVTHIIAPALVGYATIETPYQHANGLSLGLGFAHEVNPRQIPRPTGVHDNAGNRMFDYERIIVDFLTSKGIIDDFQLGQYIPLALVDIHNTAFGQTSTSLSPSYIKSQEALHIGGKKMRDHYAQIDLTSAGDGKKFELYAVNVDYDDSKIHM